MLRSAEEILTVPITKSGLYFDNNGYRMVLVSEAVKAVNEARMETVVECLKAVTLEHRKYIGDDGVLQRQNVGQEVSLDEDKCYIAIDQDSILNLLKQIK